MEDIYKIKYENKFEIDNLIETKINYLDYYKNYSDREYEKIIKFLIDSEYLIDKDTITIYGKMASIINECNPFILIEIFEGNILNKLSENEIIMLISIFCDTNNTTVDYNGYVIDAIEYIKERINIYLSIEKEIGIDPSEYFNINIGYLDITKLWINLDLDKQDYGVILSKLNEMNEYEGNFIKNMIKINNIIDNLISLCDIKKDYSILPKLESLSNKIMKGIVNVESLYVT
jgi:superfamily II RNA helicase